MARKEDVFPVTINYDFSLAEMVAAGKYDWANDDITAENFPVSGNGRHGMNLELVHFNRVMEFDDTLKELDKDRLRPAMLAGLLAFGAKYPDKQRGFPVVALGSVWQNCDGDCGVPVLWGDSGRRYLLLFWLEDEWDEDYRFLACRK